MSNVTPTIERASGRARFSLVWPCLVLAACGGRTSLDHTSWFPLVAEDFDGDGLPDLLAATMDGLEIFTSDGKRGFRPEGRADGFSQSDAFAAVAGDLNGDGRIDAVVSGYGDVRVLLNTCR